MPMRCKATMPIIGMPDKEVSGLFPRVILTVDTSTRDMRDNWKGCCYRLGITTDICQELSYTDTDGNAYSTVYDCVGTALALESLIMQCRAVIAWQYAIGLRVPYQGQGAGPEKIKGKPKARGKGKWHETANNPDMSGARLALHTPSQGYIVPSATDTDASNAGILK
jgi:hypothetical protein